jgi:hypothetical protein
VGHLGCIYSVGIMNNGAVNIGVQVPLLQTHLHSFRYFLKSGIVGLYGSSVFSSLKSFQTFFHCGYANLHSYVSVFSFFSTFSPTFVIVCALDGNHSSTSEVES